MTSPWSSYRGQDALDAPMPESSAAAAAQPVIPPPPTTEPPMSVGYPETGGYIVLWQVEDWGCWVDYSKDFCVILEQAREKGTKMFQYRPRGNKLYTYNLEDMYQEQDLSKTRRTMRRTLWWVTEVNKYPLRKSLLETHNKENSDPKAGQVPSGSPSRQRSRSQSHARGGYGGPPHGGAASSSRGWGG